MSDKEQTTVLVTGASGFIGQALVGGLVRSGFKVIAVVRDVQKASFDSAVELYQQPNICHSSTWDRDLLARVDVVFHLAGRAHVINETESDPLELFREVNVRGSLALAYAADKAGVKRFVFISSIGVMGNHSGDKPFTALSVPNPHDGYAISKLEAERELSSFCGSSDMSLVIVRPPLVYGPENPGNFERLIGLINSGLPLPFGAIKSQRSFIYVENLVDVLITCGSHPAALDKVWLVSDGDDKSLAELLRGISQLLDKPLRLVSFPLVILTAIGRLFGRSKDIERLVSSLVVDSSETRERLDWTPPFTLAEGLEKTIDWFQSKSK